MPREPKSLDLTALVLLVAAGVAYFKGLDAALWTLVWVWAGLMALLAVVVGVLASLPAGARAAVRFGSESAWGTLGLALWGLCTALAFGYLAATLGRPLLWLPALSLTVVVFPGSGSMLLDEYVQGLLARGAALAGGGALAAALLLALPGPPGQDVALAGLAIYALVLEAYVIRNLRG